MVMTAPVTNDINKAGAEFLERVGIFSGLDESALGRISRLMVAREVKKHEIIWLEQEPATVVYFVAAGLVKLFKTSNGGKEQILRLACSGDCFGHAGVLNRGSHPESAQSVMNSMLYGLASYDLETLFGEFPQVARNALRLLATEIHHYVSLVEDLSLRCVNGRLARMLLANNAKGACDTSLVLTRADMAAMTGTVREVIGKSLKTLGDKGVIRYDRRQIIIRDREALKSLMSSI